MYKKRDKFKTIGQEMKLRNIIVNDIEDIYHFETKNQSRTKSTKTIIEKGKSTFKTNTKLIKAKVVEIMTNYRYRVWSLKTDNSVHHTINCILSGRLKYITHSSKNPICVGDFVNVDISDINNPRIEEIFPRKNMLSRYIYPNEVLLAANIDQVIILASIKDPDFNSRLIDRYITAAGVLQIPAILCINKIDIAEKLNKRIGTYYKKNGYPVIYTSAITGEGIEKLKKVLKNKVTVITGHSGTGKTSLINLIEPGLNLRTGDVSMYHNKGVHTTTSSIMIPWSIGGYIIDTPGIKTLGFKPDDINKLSECFPGFSKYSNLCLFNNCTHTHEKNCGVKDNININIPEERYASYLFLRENLC